MIPPIGDNLASRAAAILLGSFAVTAILLAFLMLRPSRDQPGAGLFQLPVPAETKAIVDALEASSPAARPLMVKALNSGVTAVRLDPRFPPVPAGLQRAPRFQPLLETYTRLLGDRTVRIYLSPRGTLLQQLGLLPPGNGAPAIRLMVGLKTGEVLIIEHRAPVLARDYLARVATFLAGVAFILLAGLTLAVRQTSRPVRRLADAARRFSLDQQAPDLPTTGPMEVRDLATAFNELQSRIRGLVSERTRLLAAIAHDLRTYLTRLRLRAEFIDDEGQRGRAERDIDEMAQLIDDTLLFALQATRPTPSPADGCDFMEEIRGLVAQRQYLGEPVALEDGRTAPRPLRLGCSAPSLRRMLNNLIDNAVRYGDRARVEVRASKNALEVVVEDDGPGVPAAALADLAQPFLRLETSRGRDTGGAGLGLAIVKSLAESCGGALELSNGPMGGLRALLRFPVGPRCP